jgi:hypothetical protein
MPGQLRRYHPRSDSQADQAAELSTAHALDFEMVRLDLVQRVMENATTTTGTR